MPYRCAAVVMCRTHALGLGRDTSILKFAASYIYFLFYCQVNLKDKQKRNVIVIALVSNAIAVVFGVLLIAYYIGKRTKGNITFYDTEKILHDCLVELLETYIAANKMMRPFYN